MDAALLEKETRLKDILRAHARILIAYSGGVDSTYLAAVAAETLCADAFLFLADTPSIPRSEFNDARALAAMHGWQLHIAQTDEFHDEAFLRNDGLRCYHCKGRLFTTMRAYAATLGITIIAHGENASDLADPTRAGSRAAQEAGAVAPLRDAGLFKPDIRALSAHRGLPTADKPSFACLGSRFPTGTPLDIETMGRIEQAEEVLKRLGFAQYRVRHHGPLCRIEVPLEDIARVAEPDMRTAVVEGIRAAGYQRVSLDLAGYRDPTQS